MPLSPAELFSLFERGEENAEAEALFGGGQFTVEFDEYRSGATLKTKQQESEEDGFWQLPLHTFVELRDHASSSSADRVGPGARRSSHNTADHDNAGLSRTSSLSRKFSVRPQFVEDEDREDHLPEKQEPPSSFEHLDRETDADATADTVASSLDEMASDNRDPKSVERLGPQAGTSSGANLPSSGQATPAEAATSLVPAASAASATQTRGAPADPGGGAAGAPPQQQQAAPLAAGSSAPLGTAAPGGPNNGGAKSPTLTDTVGATDAAKKAGAAGAAAGAEGAKPATPAGAAAVTAAVKGGQVAGTPATRKEAQAAASTTTREPTKTPGGLLLAHIENMCASPFLQGGNLLCGLFTVFLRTFFRRRSPYSRL